MNTLVQTYSSLISRFHLKENEPLKPYTSFKVGGPADLFAKPETSIQLTQLLAQAKKLNLPVTLIGGGTNLLISDQGIRGLVITTRELKTDIQCLETTSDVIRIQAGAGQQLSRVCRFALNQSLSGLEFAAGIPGTLGGAIIMNAGTPDGNMAGIVESVTMIDLESLSLETHNADQINFSYRQSHLKGILVDAILNLTPGNAQQIKNNYTKNLDRKMQTQPIGKASAGCFFKNPPLGKPAGQLIEEAGLKGFRINDAQVSNLHANYIVNLNNARCQDILDLKNAVQSIILEKFNIKLETEVRIEGE